MSIGCLVESSLYLDPVIPLIAFVGTVVVFACFSLSALLANEDHILYISGFLSSAMSLMFWMSAFAIKFRSAYVHPTNIRWPTSILWLRHCRYSNDC